MSQPLDYRTLLTGFQYPVKRSVFVSYHHGGDQPYYNAFTKTFDDTYDVIHCTVSSRRGRADPPGPPGPRPSARKGFAASER